MRIIYFLSYFFLFNLNCSEFEIEIFFSGSNEDLDVIEFPDKSNYRQVKNNANWQNSYGDYGILDCLFNISIGRNNKAKLEGYCDGKNQNNDKFWLEFKRDTDDFDAGIGRSKFIYGTGKFRSYVGVECIYAVKILDDSAFSKHKCKSK